MRPYRLSLCVDARAGCRRRSCTNPKFVPRKSAWAQAPPIKFCEDGLADPWKHRRGLLHSFATCRRQVVVVGPVVQAGEGDPCVGRRGGRLWSQRTEFAWRMRFRGLVRYIEGTSYVVQSGECVADALLAVSCLLAASSPHHSLLAFTRQFYAYQSLDGLIRLGLTARVRPASVTAVAVAVPSLWPFLLCRRPSIQEHEIFKLRFSTAACLRYDGQQYPTLRTKFPAPSRRSSSAMRCASRGGRRNNGFCTFSKFGVSGAFGSHSTRNHE